MAYCIITLIVLVGLARRDVAMGTAVVACGSNRDTCHVFYLLYSLLQLSFS